MSEPKAAAQPMPPRPRENPDLIGHEGAERQVLAAFASGRMPHAWLIGGLPGVGKATLAFRIARFVLAQTADGAVGAAAGLFGAPPPPASLALDPSSPSFRLVKSGAHPDLVTIERRFDEKRGKMKSEIAVEEVRDAVQFLHRTNAAGGWRVVVADGVEQMNAHGHNAILKILEEPPPRALLLLVTETPGGLLPTIRSRCRKLTLPPLPEATVATLLGRYCPDLAEADRPALARLAEGSIGRACNLAEAGGLTLYRDLIALLQPLPRLDVIAVHAFADRLGRKGADQLYDTASALLVWWLARLVRSVASGTPPPEVVAGEAELIGRLTAKGSGALDRWMAVWENIRLLFARADYANLERKQVVLNALASLRAAAG
ncbi:MAG: DNA polymerase III subunit delta' [Azospirillum sp.]|nr:DNA polymerase III subunit delta' [Azospirillum sp.]